VIRFNIEYTIHYFEEEMIEVIVAVVLVTNQRTVMSCLHFSENVILMVSFCRLNVAFETGQTDRLTD